MADDKVVDWPIYKFKWSNVDLDAYLDGMRFRATELRRKAQTLIAQAEIIEEERAKLSVELLPADPKEDRRE
jgi:hypothetical protein